MACVFRPKEMARILNERTGAYLGLYVTLGLKAFDQHGLKAGQPIRKVLTVQYLHGGL